MPLVSRHEIFMRHVDFAAYLEIFRRVDQSLNDIINDPRIFRNVLALIDSVAARYRLNKFPVLVAQRQRQAVNFLLDYEFRRIQFRKRVVDEIFHVFAIEHVLQ